MDNNEEEFKRKTEREIKNYDLLKSIFNKIYDIEKDLQKKRKGAFEEIIKIDEKDNETLKEIYSQFTKEMKDLEQLREKLMEKIKQKLIPAATYYSYKAKQQKKSIGHYDDKKKENKKQQYEMEKAKASRNELKESKLNEDLAKSRNEIKEAGESLEKDIMKFEADRLDDNKFIILHFIHCEMNYHAKSVEKLGQLFKDITNSNPKFHLKEFAENFKFQSVNLEDYGYDEREFTKKSIHTNKSTLKASINESRQKSLRVSGLGNSRGGMLQKSQYKDDLEEIEEEVQSNNDI